MTGTDEARRLIKAYGLLLSGLGVSQGSNALACDAWLTANPEGKLAAGVTEALENAYLALHALGGVTGYNHDDQRILAYNIERLTGSLAALSSAVPAAPETIPAAYADLIAALHEARVFIINYGDKRYELKALVVLASIEHALENSAAPAVSQPPADTREMGNG